MTFPEGRPKDEFIGYILGHANDDPPGTFARVSGKAMPGARLMERNGALLDTVKPAAEIYDEVREITEGE